MQTLDRGKRVKARACGLWLLACLGLASLVAFFAYGSALFEKLEARRERIEKERSSRLRDLHGFVVLASMDGACPMEAVSRRALVVSRCKPTAGKAGDARRVNLDKNGLLRINLRFRVEGNEATYAAWFRPVSTARRQVLFNQGSHEAGFALLLEAGKLWLHLASPTGEVVATCPYAGGAGVMSHVAVAFSSNSVAIYQNGRETHRQALAEPVRFPLKPLIYGPSLFWPFEGDIDELAVWSRSLGAKEVAAVACARFGLEFKYEPRRTASLMLVRHLNRALSKTYRVFDRLIPSGRQPATMAKEIPILMVWPSKRDERHFSKAHEDSRRNGFRTGKAAAFRGIDVAYDGRIVRLDVALDNVYGRDGDMPPPRMAFLLRDKSRMLLGGSGLARVYPPELHTVVHPDAPCPLPLSATFVRLYFGNIFKGLYIIEPFDRTGSAWLAYGSHGARDAHAIGFDSPLSPCDRAPEGQDPQEAFEKVAALVSTDMFFPWSHQELCARCRQLDRFRRDNAFNPRPEDPARRILKDNVSALYVTGDLDLSGAPGVRWESSDPAIVSATGKVSRPESGAPQSVILTPVPSRIGSQEPIRVRVIPRRPDLQTLFLHIGTPVEKERRVDFSCFRIPAGGGEGEWHTGTAGKDGGLHHRGNTSYVRGDKRSMSLKFDSPVDFLEDGLASCHLVLICGYGDPTRLRNRLSFDAYRAAAGSDALANGITSIDWAEVFINGEYFGVWELAHRVRDVLPADDVAMYKVASRQPPLWTGASPANSVPVSPADPRADNAVPLGELYAAVSSLSGPAFADMARKTFRLEPLADYYLILNLSENQDGRVSNVYIVRSAVDGRWFVVPWDYDKTFQSASRVPLTNNLLEKLRDDVPEFKPLVASRWKTLRSGLLSDEALFAQFDAMAVRLAPYMAEEYRLRQPLGTTEDFPSTVRRLRGTVAERLAVVDALCQ